MSLSIGFIEFLDGPMDFNFLILVFGCVVRKFGTNDIRDVEELEDVASLAARRSA